MAVVLATVMEKVGTFLHSLHTGVRKKTDLGDGYKKRAVDSLVKVCQLFYVPWMWLLKFFTGLRIQLTNHSLFRWNKSQGTKGICEGVSSYGVPKNIFSFPCKKGRFVREG